MSTRESGAEYEGWANRETWAVALHVNNDQGWQANMHEALREHLASRAAIPETIKAQTETGPEGAAYLAYLAGEVVKEQVTNELSWDDVTGGSPETETETIRAFWTIKDDIGSLWRVDWTELGAAFLADLGSAS